MIGARKRKIVEVEEEELEQIDPVDGWPTTRQVMANGSDAIYADTLSFTIAKETLIKYKGPSVILSHNYPMGIDGKPIIGGKEQGKVFVYHPQAAPHGFNMPGLSTIDRYVAHCHIIDIRPFPAYMCYNVENPIIKTKTGNEMHNIQVKRLEPNKDMDVTVFNMIPKHMKKEHDVQLISGSVLVHEGDPPVQV